MRRMDKPAKQHGIWVKRAQVQNKINLEKTYKPSKRKQVEKQEAHLFFTMYFNKHLLIHSINTKKNNLHHLQHNLQPWFPFSKGRRFFINRFGNN